MARIFKTPFGAQGDTEQVPEAPQGDGSVSLTQGFGYDYEREYEDPAAKDIRREVMNGLFHDVTEAIGDIQLSGVAKWDAAAAPYPAGAVVWHSSAAWESLVGNNSSEPSEGASWSRLATINDVSSGYVPQSRTITAGTGLAGGGNLTANRTISIANSHIPIGVGQTWQDVTASRASGTNYTNTTGRPIYISIVHGEEGAGAWGYLHVDGVSVAYVEIPQISNWGEKGTLSAVVPSGSTYVLTDLTGGIESWSELR